MKTYRRASDNFEVQDEQGHDLAWVNATYGDGFIEVENYVPSRESMVDTERQIRKEALEALIDEKIAASPGLATRMSSLNVEA